MAQIICIIGNKGGTGKTTVSHMLAQGFGLLGQRSACVLTDTAREPLSPEGRRYLTADARSPEALGKVMDKLRTLNGWMGVIDGGGNRSETDRRLYSLADLVLLPFRDSHEDIRTVVKDLELFPRAWALPSQWPTQPVATRGSRAHHRHATRRIQGPSPRAGKCTVEFQATLAEAGSGTTADTAGQRLPQPCPPGAGPAGSSLRRRERRGRNRVSEHRRTMMKASPRRQRRPTSPKRSGSAATASDRGAPQRPQPETGW